MDTEAELRADCARCQGLCCVALPFDRSAWFAFDKLAHVPCDHLNERSRCAIHAELGERGQAGCQAYDCYGAGQRVCGELFGGRSWRREPELLAAMCDALPGLRDVHELRLLLRQAGQLELSGPARARCQQLLHELEPACGYTPARLAHLNLEQLRRETFAYLRSLRGVAGVRRPRRRLPLVSPSG
ncbi:MAG TPA: hypothetical protein VHB79_23190 [Polyangiaceae bacterium]|nr:hypothetical protein [Polyangiaceae bacterium]